MVGALDFYPNRPGSNPMIGGKFFQLCLIPLLHLSCRKKILRKLQASGPPNSESHVHFCNGMIYIGIALITHVRKETILAIKREHLA